MRGSIEVHRYLTERQIPHEFYRLGRPLRNIDEVAALLDLLPSHVVTAELFESKTAPVLALVPAGVCASVANVARASDETRIRPATPARVTEHTGFLAGWLPPVGHERTSRAVLDADLAEVDVLYAPGGDPGVMLVLRSGDLIRATAATVAPLATPADEPVEQGPVHAIGGNLLAG
jgi:prolyl-tRNA editing enzyme YbaK/EbsC (Cys-tRNA(Pro) deacylase)